LLLVPTYVLTAVVEECCWQMLLVNAHSHKNLELVSVDCLSRLPVFASHCSWPQISQKDSSYQM